jgi:phosphohistidine phosphatase SixA
MIAKQFQKGIGKIGRLSLYLLVNALLVYACATQPRPVSSPTSPIATTPYQPLVTSVYSTPTAEPISTSRPLATATSPLPTIEPSSTPQPFSTSNTPAPLEGAELVEALRRGGYVIYFRHAATDQSQTDTNTQNLEDCSRQRNLTEEGRAQARAIGESFLSLNIPVGLVLSSGYCRARDTAMLAFGQAEITSDLTGFPDELREQRITALRQMLSAPPLTGTNTILVAHGFNITNTAGITIEEGEAAIFAPLEADGFALVARILPDEWAKLERLVVGSLVVGLGSDSNLLLPDLQTVPPSEFDIRIYSVTGKRLLRFTNSIQNNGPGVMELWGYSEPASGKTIVVQRIYNVDGSSFKNLVAGEFIFHPEHNHWHVEGFSRYELWSLDSSGALDTIVAVSDKVSYCLRDDARSNLSDAPKQQTYLMCDVIRQGIAIGWIDIYEYYLPGQSIDITDVPDGIYALRSIVDPGNQFRELNRSNNAVVVYIEIESDRVRNVDTTEILTEEPVSDK